MSNIVIKVISHPLLALGAAVLAGLFEFIALQRSRFATSAMHFRQRAH
jgi:hypothetical protein